MPNVTRPPPHPADPYQSNGILPPAPQMFYQGVGDRTGFNQGFGDRTGFIRCETNRQGNGQWKKLMMEMKGLQEKKARLGEQHLQEGGSDGMSLQERRLQEEETLLGRRFREEREKNQRFDLGGEHEGWVNEQRHEKSEWRAEKKLKLEEARELDRMWDMVNRKGKYEESGPQMRRRNWPEESRMGSDSNRGEQGELKGKRTLDLSEEIAARERELRRREEKLRQEERKLDETYRAEKERNLREREERLRRKERELEEISSARKSGRSAVYDNLGSREWSRSSDRSSSVKYEGTRKFDHDHEKRSGKLEVDDEVTLEISIPNQPGDLRWQDDRGRRELSRSRSDSSRGESGAGSRDVRSVNYDHDEMQKQLSEKDERKLYGRSGARRLRRDRSRRPPWGTYSQNRESPLRQPSETSFCGFRHEDEAVPKAPVKSRLGVKRGVKERLGKRSKLAKQEMERDLSTVHFEGRVIAELQERSLDLAEDGGEFNMFDQEEEDAWSEEEDFYDEELH